MFNPQETESSFTLYIEGRIFSATRFHQQLIDYWQVISQCSQPNIIVDFSRCRFLGHNGVAFLGGLAQLAAHQGRSINFAWDTLHGNIFMNLGQNGFLHAFGRNQKSWDGNSIPYRQDLGGAQPSLIDYLESKWLGKGWLGISPKLRNKIVSEVWEIYANAFEHSNSPIGVFTCGQHYPTRGLLELATVDFGRGIVDSVRSLPENSEMTSPEALEWAFREGTSTKQTNVSRGLGLNLLETFITANHGQLRLFSNDACVAMDDNGVRYNKTDVNFSGTLVNISLKCDESYYCLASEADDSHELPF